MKFRIVTAIVILGLSSGCLSSTSHDISPALARQKTETDGIVVGSIGTPHKDNPYIRLILKTKHVGLDERAWAFLDRTDLQKTPLDFKDADIEGAIFAMKIPAGEYEFRNFVFFWNAGFFQKEFSAAKDFSIRFEVKSNQITYLGEFVGVPVFGKNVFGGSVPAGGFWIVSDQRKRDLEVAQKRYPNESFDNVDVAIPDVDALKLPFFVTRAKATSTQRESSPARAVEFSTLIPD